MLTKQDIRRVLSLSGTLVTVIGDKLQVTMTVPIKETLSKDNYESYVMSPYVMILDTGNQQILLADYLVELMSDINITIDTIVDSYLRIRDACLSKLNSQGIRGKVLKSYWGVDRSKRLSEVSTSCKSLTNLDIELLDHIISLSFCNQKIFDQILSYEELSAILSTGTQIATYKELQETSIAFCGANISLAELLTSSKPHDRTMLEHFSDGIVGYKNIKRDLAMIYHVAVEKQIGNPITTVREYKKQMFSRYQGEFTTSLKKSKEYYFAIIYNSLLTLDPSVDLKLFSEESIVRDAEEFDTVSNTQLTSEFQ